MSQQALKAKYYPISHISLVDFYQMYAIYSRYYQGTKWRLFLSDLSQKNGAFLIRKKKGGEVVGFSTIVNKVLLTKGKKGVGVFSGDTIIDRAYWGSRVLQVAFYKYILRQKALHPTRPVYWLLISKGFKTYLLLANNFYKFYPHPDNQYVELGDVVDNYCHQMFPDYYDQKNKILDFGEHYQCLKEGVAEIDEDMSQRNRNISFFEKRNPEWRRGTELPCVGVIDWSSLVKYCIRYLKKPISKGCWDARKNTMQSGAVRKS